MNHPIKETPIHPHAHTCTPTHTHTYTHTYTHTHTHTYIGKRKAEQMMSIKVLSCTFGNDNKERQREKVHD